MRYEFTVVTHRRPVGVMHQAAWLGIEAQPTTDEATVLAQMGAAGWALTTVLANAHDTERRYYFKRALGA
jgi:hypothetical protein